MREKPADLGQYRRDITSLKFGKRVGLFLYIHKDAAPDLPSTVRASVNYADRIAASEGIEFDVVKLGTNELLISLLSYPRFWKDAFPILDQSAKLDFDSHGFSVTNYGERENPPVLHRKELLLPPDHDRFQEFAALTAQAEALGLFQNSRSIGHLKGWQNTLDAANVEVSGNTLNLLDSTEGESRLGHDVEIQRYKSAIRRKHLSQPFQVVQRYGYLDGDYSVFDYGCGKADDLELLRGMQVEADGWDPHFLPDRPKMSADIVNLGFVVNVIEDRAQRDQALRDSFALAKRFLVVSALIGNPEYSGPTNNFNDGVVTSIGTFQKYYLPDELENYVRSVVGSQVISVAQGVVIAFKTEEEADRLRARRAGLRSGGTRGSLQKASEAYLLDENARDVLTNFWHVCLALGREPLASELGENEDLSALGLSPSAAFKYLVSKFGDEGLSQAALARATEMLVHFALGNFDGRVYFKYLPDDVKRDITEFFGGYKKLQEQSKALLFSISDTTLLAEACSVASSDGLGYMLTEDSLQLHVSCVDRLPAILRVYIGCAERLIGGIGRASLVKIHVYSGKASFMAYDDFERQAIPYLVERIKVNLWHRKIDYFDYIAGYAPPPLLMKSLYLPEDHEHFDEQSIFDGRLMKSGLFDISNPHPARSEFESALEMKGLEVRGFELADSTR